MSVDTATIHRPGDKAETIVKRDGKQVAEVVVEIHDGALQVFVHRYEGFDVPVKTFVV